MNNFNKEQLEQINLGLNDKIDVSIYSKRYFDADQMRQIRFGLMHNIDVSIYAHPYFDSNQMYQIRNGLEEGIPAIIYAIPDLSSDDMEVIYNVINIYLYNNPDLNIKNSLIKFKEFYVDFLLKKRIFIDCLNQNIEIVKNDIKQKVKYAKR